MTYRVETTWDDETGNAEIREFDQQGLSFASASGLSGPSTTDARI